MPTLPFSIDTDTSDKGPGRAGTAEYLGGGVFLTAAHVFQGYRNGNLVTTDSGQVAGPTGPIPFGNLDFKVYPKYDPSITQGTINRSRNYYDIAYVRTAGGNIPASATNPIIAFADGGTATSYLQAQSISFAGRETSSDTGTVSEVVPAPIGMPGSFRANMSQPTQEGDSGSGATIEQNGQSYLVGVLSGKLQSTGESQFTYLDAKTYGRLTSGLNPSDFQGISPDVIEGQSPKDHIRGSARKANILTNGDADVILAGSGGGLVNTGVGSNDVVFMPSTSGTADSGTTFVVSPGSKTLVGGGPNDKLVVLTDELHKSDDSTSTPATSSSTMQLKGAYSDGLYGTASPVYIFGTSYTTSDNTAPIPSYDCLGYCTLQSQADGTNDLNINFQTGTDWTSSITINNYKDGDFGFHLTANNEAGEANVKQNWDQVFDDEYAAYKKSIGYI